MENKTTELQKFKKADKARKLVLANRAGYASTEAYLIFLLGKPQPLQGKLLDKLKEILEKQPKETENKKFKNIVIDTLSETIRKTMPSVKTDYQIGDIVTITQHYKVINIDDSKHLPIYLKKIEGGPGDGINTDLNTLKSVFKSGDNFKYQEEKTRTELIEILEGNKHSCMTVGFFKKDVEKSKAQYELEKRNLIDKIKSANIENLVVLVNDLMDNPPSKTIPGEYRIMRGYHYNTHDAHGRLQFIDADSKEENKMKLVDPRSIDLVICDNTKYVLKK